MKLKSTYATLVALIVLTAMPHALDQLSDLKNFAQERFRTELLNIFWSFTTPETRSAANRDSTLLARTQTGASRCNGSNEVKQARAARVAGGVARALPFASALGHRQPLTADEPPAPENQIANTGTVVDGGEKILETGEHVSFGQQKALRLDNQKSVALISSNLKSAAHFDEAFLPQQLDDAVSQLVLTQEDETAQPPADKQASLQKRALPNVQRFAQKFVQSNFQLQLPENLEKTLSDRAINTDTFIKAFDALMPVKAKCRVRVIRVAPEAPRMPDKPVTIS